MRTIPFLVKESINIAYHSLAFFSIIMAYAVSIFFVKSLRANLENTNHIPIITKTIGILLKRRFRQH